MDWVFLAGSVLGLLVLLLFEGRRRERTVVRDWELVLTPKASRELDRVSERTGIDLALVDLSWEQATTARDRGSLDEALAMLDCGCSLIETYCPTMIRMLAAMSVLSRMVAAMGPVAPLKPERFQLRQLTQLAYMNNLVRQFLVTAGERFRLRVYTLQRGFVLLSRVAARTMKVAKLAPSAPWEDFNAAREDTHALTHESIESFRTLLMALGAERR